MNRLLLAVGPICLLIACSRTASDKKGVASEDLTGLPAKTVVATVDGAPVTAAEIVRAIDVPLRTARNDYQVKIYDLQRGALDQLIMSRLVEAEAKRLGKTPKEWMEQEILPKVPEPTEDALRKAYADARDSLGGATFEQSRGLLREQLRHEAGQKLFGEQLEKFAAAHAVQVLLTPPEVLRLQVDAMGPSRGDPQAPVTIVEYADFQCPFSARAAPVLARLVGEYQGKVRLVFKHFPLPVHPNATRASEAAACATDAGKFWEMHDQLFADQAKLAVADLEATAQKVGLDAVAFNACLERGQRLGKVEADVFSGKVLGVTGTPAFFINGVQAAGALSYEDFKAAVDRELRVARK